MLFPMMLQAIDAYLRRLRVDQTVNTAGTNIIITVITMLCRNNNRANLPCYVKSLAISNKW